jgi:4-hydroxybenzoate polyprenyltransferase
MGIPAGWQLRRAWRQIVLVVTFFALAYFGLEEVHGENSLAAWLVFFGAIAVSWGLAKVWPEPQREDT